MNQRSLLSLATLLLGMFYCSGGCAEPSGPKTVDNKDLSVKIPAIKHAAETKDRAAATELVHDLESDDPAVRLYAIEGLQRLTGEDFGYRYYDDKDARKEAVAKWQDWLKQQKH